MAKQRVVLCGKNGSIGSFLDAHLRRLNIEVIAWGSKESNWLDLSRARDACRSLGSTPVTFLFLSAIGRKVQNDFASFSDNVRMIYHFIEAQRECRNAHTIFFSSACVYGRSGHLPLTEESPLNPDSWYGFSKVVSEWVLRRYLPGEIPVTVLRLPGVFGQTHRDQSVIGQFKSQIDSTGRVTLNGTGECLRDFLYVEDLARLVGRLIEKPVRETFNVASGHSISVKGLLDLIQKVYPSPFEIVPMPSEADRDFDLTFDNTKIRSFFPDFAFTDLKQSLASFLTKTPDSKSVFRS